MNTHLAKVFQVKANIERELAKQLEFHTHGLKTAWNVEQQIKGHKAAAREFDAAARIYAGKPAAFYIDEEIIL